MLDYKAIKAIVDDIECKPYAFRIGCINCVRLRRNELEPRFYEEWLASDRCLTLDTGRMVTKKTRVDHVFFLQACLHRPDTNSGEMGWGTGGKYFISPHMTASEITRVALKACLAYSEHETREAFLYRGDRVYGPHLAVDGLRDTAQYEEVREPRNASVQTT